MKRTIINKFNAARKQRSQPGSEREPTGRVQSLSHPSRGWDKCRLRAEPARENLEDGTERADGEVHGHSERALGVTKYELGSRSHLQIS